MAKWPVDKTPTLSDVLFSIPLRQNQNNRTAANKNKITFPISIPDRENLQEEKLGKEPEMKGLLIPPLWAEPFVQTNNTDFNAEMFNNW